MLKDLTLWHWGFFLQRRTRNERDEKAQHWQEFSAAVESVARWAGAGHAPVMVPEETLPRQSSVVARIIPRQFLKIIRGGSGPYSHIKRTGGIALEDGRIWEGGEARSEV